jgi:hypothetical protein
MTREEAIRCLSVYSSTNGSGLCTDEQHYEAKQIAIKALEQEPCEDAGWIPVKWHEITDEERKQNEYPKEWAVYLDCVMPDDGQEILTTTKGGYIEFDTCFHDGCGYSLDSARDWIADITAWMPLPKPWKGDKE